MLPPYIIEEIRRREEERKQRHRWPLVELPLEDLPPMPQPVPRPEPGRREEEPSSRVDDRI